MTGAELVQAAYDGLRAALALVDDEQSWAPTGCLGWSVRDLTYHCTMDAQRALVALHTPATDRPDRDAVSYWQGWGDDPESDANGRRWTRVNGSMFGDWEQLRNLHAETAAAVVDGGSAVPPTRRLATQGHVLTADDLLRTLAVEAAVHHLDLTEHRDLPAPDGAALAETRRVLDALAGSPFPEDWDDERVVRIGTGRVQPEAQERLRLGAVTQRLPLFS